VKILGVVGAADERDREREKETEKILSRNRNS